MCSMLVVTHEKALVDRFAKRVITIDHGHLVRDSEPGPAGWDLHNDEAGGEADAPLGEVRL